MTEDAQAPERIAAILAVKFKRCEIGNCRTLYPLAHWCSRCLLAECVDLLEAHAVRLAQLEAELDRLRDAFSDSEQDLVAKLALAQQALLTIAGYVNSYHNDGTTLSAAETLRAIAEALGMPMEAALAAVPATKDET